MDPVSIIDAEKIIGEILDNKRFERDNRIYFINDADELLLTKGLSPKEYFTNFIRSKLFGKLIPNVNIQLNILNILDLNERFLSTLNILVGTIFGLFKRHTLLYKNNYNDDIKVDAKMAYEKEINNLNLYIDQLTLENQTFRRGVDNEINKLLLDDIRTLKKENQELKDKLKDPHPTDIIRRENERLKKRIAELTNNTVTQPTDLLPKSFTSQPQMPILNISQSPAPSVSTQLVLGLQNLSAFSDYESLEEMRKKLKELRQKK